VSPYFHYNFRGIFIAMGVCAVSFFIGRITEFLYTRHELKSTGNVLTLAEACFRISYVQFAKHCNVDQDINITIEELIYSDWHFLKESYDSQIGRDSTNI
jgi:hypothetical protein